MEVIGQLQPWIIGQKLVVRTPPGERNAQRVTEDGVTLGEPLSLRDGTEVVVAELRSLQFTDVLVGGQRYRMLSNSYLCMA